MAAELVLSHLPSTSSKDEAFIERHKDVGIENWTPETVFGYEAFIERHMDVGIENWTPETVFGYLGTQPYLSTWLPTLGADHPLKTVSGRTLLVLPELNPDIYLREFFDGNVVAFAHARGMARQLAQHMPYARTKPSDVDAAAVQRMVEEAIKDRLCQCGGVTVSLHTAFRKQQFAAWQGKCIFTALPAAGSADAQACHIIPLRATYHELRVHWERGTELLGRLSTHAGKTWVLAELGRKASSDVFDLSHVSNGFLAIKEINTWFHAHRLSVDVLSNPPIMVVWDANNVAGDILDKLHGQPLPGGALLRTANKQVSRALLKFQFGLCAARYEAQWAEVVEFGTTPSHVFRRGRQKRPLKEGEPPLAIPYLDSYHEAAEAAHALVLAMDTATRKRAPSPREVDGACERDTEMTCVG